MVHDGARGSLAAVPRPYRVGVVHAKSVNNRATATRVQVFPALLLASALYSLFDANLTPRPSSPAPLHIACSLTRQSFKGSTTSTQTSVQSILTARRPHLC